MVGEYSDWNPLYDRERLFPEDLDKGDPWQFKLCRVVAEPLSHLFVFPAKGGIQGYNESAFLDSRLRGNDEET